MTLLDPSHLRADHKPPEELQHGLCCVLNVGDKCFCGALATEQETPDSARVCVVCREMIAAAGVGRCPYGGACP